MRNLINDRGNAALIGHPYFSTLPRDLVEQRGGRAPVSNVIAVIQRQVPADVVGEGFASLGELGDGGGLCFELVSDDGSDEIILRCEMRVEGAVGQSRIGHQRGDAGTIDPVTLEATTRCLNDAPSRRLLVITAVSGHQSIPSSSTS